MSLLCRLLTVAVLVLGTVSSTPLDDYISKPEPDFAWRDTGAKVTNLIFGGTAHMLNVTSLRWLDTARAAGPQGSLWSHQVAVIVPKNLRTTNVSMAVLNGNCNKDAGNGTGPSFPDHKDEYMQLADALSWQTGAISIVVYQIPNCPIVYPSDPERRQRTEDAMIAWAWLQYVQGNATDPEWLPRLPMAKAAFQCMKAVEQFTAQSKIAEVSGWVVAGASKRGWTTWVVGAARCESCSKVKGIVPMVPIVPDLLAEVHRQWQSYNGFTFAFQDYMDAGLLPLLDGPEFHKALTIIDPKYHKEALAGVPTLVVLSSDDEFMQFDWSDIWYDTLTVEKHLLIAPNSEHSLATGIPELLETAAAFFNSVARGETADDRPRFDYGFNNETGEISVTLPSGVKHGKVVLRHTHTMSASRRDFRWIRLANPANGNCTLPGIPLKGHFEGGGNCFQPMLWFGTTLEEEEGSPGVYRALPPKPPAGHWTGYYIEVFFPTGSWKTEFQLTTPGFAYPNTLPYPDCHAETCTATPV